MRSKLNIKHWPQIILTCFNANLEVAFLATFNVGTNLVAKTLIAMLSLRQGQTALYMQGEQKYNHHSSAHHIQIMISLPPPHLNTRISATSCIL